MTAKLQLEDITWRRVKAERALLQAATRDKNIETLAALEAEMHFLSEDIETMKYRSNRLAAHIAKLKF